MSRAGAATLVMPALLTSTVGGAEGARHVGDGRADLVLVGQVGDDAEGGHAGLGQLGRPLVDAVGGRRDGNGGAQVAEQTGGGHPDAVGRARAGHEGDPCR